MKKFILTSVLALSTLIFVSSQVANTGASASTGSQAVCTDLTRNLSYVNRELQYRNPTLKSNVVALQNFLVGTIDETTVDPSTGAGRSYLTREEVIASKEGYFGLSTAKAVRAFQYDNELVGTRTVRSPSSVRVGLATRELIKEIAQCSFVPQSDSSIPTVEFISVPTLNLQYDSAGKESVLNGSAVVKITAGNLPIDTSDNLPFMVRLYVNNTIANITNNTIYRVLDPTSNSPINIPSTIPANTSITIVVSVGVPTRELIPGTYTFGSSIRTLNPNPSVPNQSNVVYIMGEPTTGRNVINPLPSLSVGPIVGETSPYISGATVDATGYISLYGVHFDLPNNRTVIDGNIFVDVSKGDATSMFFGASTYNLSSGYHTIQITNSLTGNSNTISINIEAPESSYTGTASAYVMTSPAPALTLKYDSLRKESSLVYVAYINVTATGGDVMLNNYPTAYSSQGHNIYIHDVNGKVLIASGTPTLSFEAGAVKTGNPTVITSGNRATFKVTQVFNPQQMFPGVYGGRVEVYSSTGVNVLGGNTSNLVTITGEPFPHINSITCDSTQSVNCTINGFHFSDTNKLTINGTSKNVSGLPSIDPTTGQQDVTWINFKASDYTPTINGEYIVQVSTNRGVSNIYSFVLDKNPVGPINNPVTNPATGISATGAVLNMFFNSISSTYTTYFNWGDSQLTLNNELRASAVPSSPNTGQVFSGNLSGLASNKVYFYQAKAKDNTTGSVTSGSVLSFMTLGGSTAPAPTLNFYVGNNYASTVNITSGQPAYLKWSSANALLCNATGAWSGMKATSSMEIVYPQQTTTYTLSCGGIGGETNQTTKSVTVIVGSATPKPDVSFGVNPQTVSIGGSTNVSWSAKDATNCVATSSPYISSWSSGSLGTSGSKVVTGINQTTMLYVICSNVNSGLSTSQGAQVTMAAQTNLPRIISSGVTFVANSSPVAQYVVGGSNLPIAKFNVVSSNGTTGVILKDLIFTAPANTISSITVNGRSASFVGTTATIYDSGFSVPVGTSGLDLNVSATLFCANTTGGCPGVSSSAVNLALSSLTYNDGITTQSVTATAAKTPNHVLVVSKPTLTLTQSSSGTFGNGVSKIGEFKITADSAGKIELKQIPVNISTTGGLGIVAGSVQLRDSTGSTIITNTNSLNGSGNFTFAIPRQINLGSSETYTVYANISGVAGPAGTQTVTFQLGNKSSLLWNDVFGNALNLSGDLILDYPSSSQTFTAVPTAQPSGSISASASSCIIPAGESTCGVNVTWNTTNSTTPGLYNKDGALVSPASSGTNYVTTSYYGYGYMIKSNTTVLGSVTITATCAQGSSWDTNRGGCQATPVAPPIAMCGYSTPEPGCSWVQGPSYVQATGCGMQLSCTPVAPKVSPVPTTVLTVLSPNTATPSYKIGGTMLLKWRTPAGLDGVSLQVHDNSAPYKSLYTGYGINTVTNSDGTREGSMTITIPANTVPGMYTLYISTATQWDESDVYFQVFPAGAVLGARTSNVDFTGLSAGSIDPRVSLLKEALRTVTTNSNCSDLKINNQNFGAVTEECMQILQVTNGLSTTDEVDQATSDLVNSILANIILSQYSNTTTGIVLGARTSNVDFTGLAKGSIDPRVSLLKEALRTVTSNSNCSNLKIDNQNFGGETEECMQILQVDNGLPTTDEVDQATSILVNSILGNILLQYSR